MQQAAKFSSAGVTSVSISSVQSGPLGAVAAFKVLMDLEKRQISKCPVK